MPSAPSVDARGSGDASDPDAQCASCHQEIYERYKETPMARASGSAADGFLPADFVHSASGVHYQITEDGGRVWLSYEREAQTRGASDSLEGRQELMYFIGSGRRGRTYLFEQDGYWFEAPMNWYAKKKVWDMAPNFQGAGDAADAAGRSGLSALSRVGRGVVAAGGAESLCGRAVCAGGITCEACHGDGRAHVASGGKVKHAGASMRCSRCGGIRSA